MSSNPDQSSSGSRYESATAPIKLGYLFDFVLPQSYPDAMRCDLTQTFELVFREGFEGGIIDPAEDTDAIPQILGGSVSYRITVGPQQLRKAFMIRTIRPLDRPDPAPERVA